MDRHTCTIVSTGGSAARSSCRYRRASVCAAACMGDRVVGSMSMPPHAASACSSATRADARASARCPAARLITAAAFRCTARATAAIASWTVARAPALASLSCRIAACRTLSCASSASYALASSTVFSHAATKRAAAVAAASRSSQDDVGSVGDGTHARAALSEAATTDRGSGERVPSQSCCAWVVSSDRSSVDAVRGHPLEACDADFGAISVSRSVHDGLCTAHTHLSSTHVEGECEQGHDDSGSQLPPDVCWVGTLTHMRVQPHSQQQPTIPAQRCQHHHATNATGAATQPQLERSEPTMTTHLVTIRRTASTRR